MIIQVVSSGGLSSGALSAGKYAAFIWPAYAVSALGFVWMIIDTLGRARRWRQKADRLEANRLGNDRMP